MTEELKPCPFCNGLPQKREVNHWTGMRNDLIRVEFIHHCEGLQPRQRATLNISAVTEEEAIAAWNRRATPAPAQPEPMGEPVAWRWKPFDEASDFIVTLREKTARQAEEYGLRVEPLYLHPPAASTPAVPEQVDAAGVPWIVRLAEDFADACVRKGYVSTSDPTHARLLREARAVAPAVPEPSPGAAAPVEGAATDQDRQYAATVKLSERMGILRKSRPAAPKEKP